MKSVCGECWGRTYPIRLVIHLIQSVFVVIYLPFDDLLVFSFMVSVVLSTKRLLHDRKVSQLL